MIDVMKWPGTRKSTRPQWCVGGVDSSSGLRISFWLSWAQVMKRVDPL